MWSILSAFHRSEPQNVPVEAVSEDKTASDEPTQPSFLALPQEDLTLTDSVYPPPDAPLSAFDTEAVIRTQASLIRDLMWAVSMDIEDKDRYLIPVIVNLASFVHLLPASQSHHHNGRGGLFRHSLETAFYAVNIAKNRLLDVNANPADTYHNQSRWFLAVAIAALLHDTGKCLTDMTVSAPNCSSPWLPTVETLATWLAKNGVQNYYCAWNQNRIHRQHECASAVLYALLVPEATRLYLEESHSTKLRNELYEALSGIRREGGEIQATVARADAISTKKDIARQLRDGFHPGVNTPIVVCLENVMQELVQDGTWQVNEVNAPLWVTDRGIFLIWHRAYRAIEMRLNQNQYPSIPRDPHVWQEKLRESSLVESRYLVDEQSLTVERSEWRILPLPELKYDSDRLKQEKETVAEKETNNEPFEVMPSLRLNFQTAFKLTDNTLVFANIRKPLPVTVFIDGEPLTEKEEKAWLATTDVPMTAFKTKEMTERFNVPAYTHSEMASIIDATINAEDSLNDCFIPDEAGFHLCSSPYPDVPMEGLLKTLEAKPQVEVKNAPFEREKSALEASVRLSEDELLSPSQKAAKKRLDAFSHNKAAVHAPQNASESDRKESQAKLSDSLQVIDKKENTRQLKPRVDEKQPEPLKMTDIVDSLKKQLKAGHGEWLDSVLYRDDCILSSTAPIERLLKANGFSFDLFVTQLEKYQTPPILYLTDNRDFIYIHASTTTGGTL